MIEFIKGRDSPPCSLFFCLGEKWPDPENRPWERKLVVVEVNELFYFKYLAIDKRKEKKQKENPEKVTIIMII